MKRSKSVKLVLMASVVILSGCEESVQSNIITTDEQCAAYYDKDRCDYEKRSAELSRLYTAPKYKSAEDCNSEFQQCEKVSSGGGFVYMPYASGYLSSANNTAPAQALYTPRNKTGYFTGGGNKLADVAGKTTVGKSSFTPTPAGNVNRGGFGAIAAQKSSSSYGG